MAERSLSRGEASGGLGSSLPAASRGGGRSVAARRQRKVIFLLEKEGEKYGAEASEASAKYAQALEEVEICARTLNPNPQP